MTFEITGMAKKKACKRRLKRERKWLVLRIIGVISLIISIYALVLVVFNNNDPIVFVNCTMLFSTFIVVYIVIIALLHNLTSGCINERLNEHMWIEGDVLHHFWQVSFAAGLNYNNTDLTGMEYQLDLATVKDLKYDAKSGRIEFNVSGQLVLYDDFRKKHIERVHELDNSEYQHICYDYYNPCLIEVLKERGIPCTEMTLNFKIRQV